MDEISIRSHWVSAWSTSPIDASLSETGHSRPGSASP